MERYTKEGGWLNGLLILLMVFSFGCGAGKKARVRDNKVNTAISTARSYTGTPYRWGGTTRSGMDCSGLLITSYGAAGIAIPRTAKAQSKYGKKVSIYELKPGDMVFFAAKKGRRKVTHAGMVTEVNGRHDVRFIHASTSLGVTENNIFSDYYKKIFVRARRPF
ncbi:C40 family peptidase [Roseivirga sp. BDSF3-8]|uniref:C40 family peptidase n=1 Tax=Roseivirga sp. BDSF3-8 TaxID=3241598 RepID=UPI003532806C